MKGGTLTMATRTAEEQMPRPIGPTIPRWQLGEEAKITQSTAADTLGCSLSKIQKIEAGDVGIVRAELAALLDLYHVTDQHMRDQLLELQKLGKQRGWWSKF